jgi:hypothetical protein
MKTGRRVKYLKKQPEVFQSKPHVSIHQIIPMWLNEPPIDLADWCEGTPGIGRVVGVKSVLYSDGSARRWYRMAAPIKPTNKKKTRAVARVKGKYEHRKKGSSLHCES